MSYLIATPEDRFSRDEAHMTCRLVMITFYYEYLDYYIEILFQFTFGKVAGHG